MYCSLLSIVSVTLRHSNLASHGFGHLYSRAHSNNLWGSFEPNLRKLSSREGLPLSTLLAGRHLQTKPPQPPLRIWLRKGIQNQHLHTTFQCQWTHGGVDIWSDLRALPPPHPHAYWSSWFPPPCSTPAPDPATSATMGEVRSSFYKSSPSNPRR